MKNKRIILDTNLWISFLISGNLTQLEEWIQNGTITLVFSTELLEKFVEVSRRPKFQDLFSEKNLEGLLYSFDQYTDFVTVSSQIICRDKKDNFLLNLAVDGNVHYLVTGDQDLLVLKKIRKTRIVTYRELVAVLQH